MKARYWILLGIVGLLSWGFHTMHQSYIEMTNRTYYDESVERFNHERR